jgi:hypothetical protein
MQACQQLASLLAHQMNSKTSHNHAARLTVAYQRARGDRILYAQVFLTPGKVCLRLWLALLTLSYRSQTYMPDA